MRRRKLLQLLLAAIATFGLGAVVVSRLSFGDLEKLARGFDFRFLGLAFGIYLGANVVRAQRFRLLVGEGVSLRAFLRIIFVQNFMNTFLPLRAGEVSYLFMVHRTGNVAPGQNLGSLLAARALDFFVALLIPLAASPFSRGRAENAGALGWLAALALLGIVLFGVAVVKAERIASFLSERSVSSRASVVRVATLLADTLRALGMLRESQLLFRVTALSLVCWLFIYASGAALLAGTGLTLSLPDTAFAYGFPTIASMTPLYMFGGFGLYEGSVGAGLVMVGVPIGTALATGVLLHVAELLFIVATALVAPVLGSDRVRPESA